jgi:uncharacterized repeat protein (TIGR01451 family)
MSRGVKVVQFISLEDFSILLKMLQRSHAGNKILSILLCGLMMGSLFAKGAYAAPPIVTKSTSTPNATAGSTATYTVVINNPSDPSGSAMTGVSIKDDLPSGFFYNSTVSITLNGGATRTSTTDPVAGTPSPSWGTFRIPSGGSVSLQFRVNVDASTTPRTYQNDTTATYTSGSLQTATYNASSSSQEDVTITASMTTPLVSTSSAPGGSACAVPGKDGSSTTLSGIVNTYYPGISAANQSITLGSAVGAPTAITKGDLLLILQMQDGTINSTNSAQYGSGNSSNGGRGLTNILNAGVYEYAVANSDISGGVVQLVSPLTGTYTTQGQSKFQVVRVPQYKDVTISGAITAQPWNGSVGGVVALDISGTLNFSNSKIVATGAGFRGGGGRNLTGGTASAVANRDYVSSSSNNYHASKGEGVAGTPRYTRTMVSINQSGTVTTSTSVDTGSNEGYPNGSFGRGAPGNAGGGGTDPNQATNAANTGGGGGANYGSGGRGGDSWYDGFNRQPLGGVGGMAFPTSTNRIVMGGGGGAATANNTSVSFPSGGSGGGIVLVRAGTIAGNGSVEANGIMGVSPGGTDGGGAGGAGGTILLRAVNSSSPTLTLSVNGGNGNNSGYWAHGPGGGGGGGYVAYQGVSSPTTSVSGGVPGNDLSGSGNPYGYTDPYANPAPDPYGAMGGEAGLAQSVSIPNAGVAPGALCNKPSVLLSKRITAITSKTITTSFESTAFNAASIPSDPSAANPLWPAGYLKGGGVTDATPNPIDPVDNYPLQPGDEVEYTIYFLSNGNATANNVLLCDRIPANTTFVPDAFNQSGSPSDRGIHLSFNGSTQALTNVPDSDAGQYFAPGADPTSVDPKINCGGANTNGTVVINLGNLPAATSPGTPANSYGFVRFRGRIR